jgi:hypothetical protein
MSSVVYAIVFKGQILEGFETFSVKAHLAQMMNADAAKMATLFSGKQIVLKRTEDKQQAVKYGSALKKVGADVTVRVIKGQQASAAGRGATPAGSAEEGSITLAPNTGNLVEAKAEVPPPDLDLSGLSIADAGQGTLGEPREEMAKVEAPDFGLDAPGALLETLTDEVELLNPDTSDLSMADAGTDLLDPADRDQDPAPQAPDTSNIQLESNSDR